MALTEQKSRCHFGIQDTNKKPHFGRKNKKLLNEPILQGHDFWQNHSAPFASCKNNLPCYVTIFLYNCVNIRSYLLKKREFSFF